MSELKALAHDVTKNDGDVLLYEKEYVQLQEQFKSTVAEEFNGVRLFSPNSPPEHLYLEHPERENKIQVSRPTLGDLHTGETLRVGKRIDFVSSTKKEYSLIEGTFNWHQAKADAESRGGHLATVGSAEEWAEIAPLAAGNTVWLGATDESNEGKWEWVDGSPFTFSTWDVGQPDNKSGINPLLQQDYLVSIPTLNWDDRALTEAPGDYILEKDINTLIEAESYLSIRDLNWSDLHATIMQVAAARAQNGAEQMQLHMEKTLNFTNLVNMKQSLSRIQDVDVAKASTDLSRSKILLDTGTAIASQANTSQKTLLQLIDQGGN
jgi:flagellin-like hook-associated protein FlgL